jgi:hypothetical protein
VNNVRAPAANAAAGTFTSTQPSANALTQVVLRSKNKEI